MRIADCGLSNRQCFLRSDDLSEESQRSRFNVPQMPICIPQSAIRNLIVGTGAQSRQSLRDAFLVTLFGDFSAEPRANDLFHLSRIDGFASSVKTFAPLCSRELRATNRVTSGSTHTGTLFAVIALPTPAPSMMIPTCALPSATARATVRKVRVVNSVFRVCAKIVNSMSLQRKAQFLFHFKATVIGAHGNQLCRTGTASGTRRTNSISFRARCLRPVGSSERPRHVRQPGLETANVVLGDYLLRGFVARDLWRILVSGGNSVDESCYWTFTWLSRDRALGGNVARHHEREL